MTRADAPRLPVIWIGGSPGAGKSTRARELAHPVGPAASRRGPGLPTSTTYAGVTAGC
ncbi:hypothetical protein [Kribbella alba]|uniref:hypothetical protein n=1 Tax=Kribbella alba TaxID=190197 RepID=UPI0031D337C2